MTVFGHVTIWVNEITMNTSGVTSSLFFCEAAETEK